MDLALSIQEFVELGRNTHIAEVFYLPNREGRICVSTQPNIGVSEVLHYHDEPHLTLVVNGGVIDKRKNFDAEKVSGGLMFFQSGECHQTINKIFPTKYVTLTLDWSFLRRKAITEAKLDSLVNQNPNSKFTLLRIYKECLENDGFSDSAIEMLLFNLIDEKNEVKKKRPGWIEKVCQLLNDNWNKDISLNDLAFAADVHSKTVSRYFPKYFACTLGEYRRQIKIAKSISLIKTTKLSLTEIAHECNFADQSHFIRDFKRMTGFLPNQFKKL